MDGEEKKLVILVIVLALIGGISIGGLIKSAITDMEISQETGDKICFDLTLEEGVVAKDYEDFNGDRSKPIEKGELYCQIPSYDETHLIKVGN